MKAQRSQSTQMTLDTFRFAAEDPRYLSEQLVTYIGNKRALLGPIGNAVAEVKRRLGKDRLRVLDAFSGSGVVSRLLKAHSSLLISNDIEYYAWIIAACYLRNRSTVNRDDLADVIEDLNSNAELTPVEPGFIEELYAPRDESKITPTDRVFYTKSNAKRIDNYRRMIGDLPDDIQVLLMGPLLSQASVHANTAGVFKGFYRNTATGIGQFGGTGSDALRRILGPIHLQAPILSNFECEVVPSQKDANQLATELTDLDLTYIDPPYNQHPYGSNYFMLNLIAKYQRPGSISRASGIPQHWVRSGYNSRKRAFDVFAELLTSLDSKFLLISYNSEGFISFESMNWLLDQLGTVDTVDIPYNTFRGSRNLRSRSIHVTERLLLVERS